MDILDNKEKQILTINGIDISYCFFDELRILTPDNVALRITKVDGTVTMQQKFVPNDFWDSEDEN